MLIIPRSIPRRYCWAVQTSGVSAADARSRPGLLRRVIRSMPFARGVIERVRLLRVAGRDLFAARLFLLVRPYTMVSDARLRSVYDIARQLEAQQVPGAFVECGVWRGGSAAVMAAVAARARSGRTVWLFDSFEGLPEPTERDGSAAATYSGQRAGGDLRPIDKLVASPDDVGEVMRKVGVDARSVELRKGWFQDTLPGASREIGPIALLRLDGDWYESTMVCLEQLYDLVVPGGAIVIDDYDYWEGCRKAVDEFLARRSVVVRLLPVRTEGPSADGRYFYRPAGVVAKHR